LTINIVNLNKIKNTTDIYQSDLMIVTKKQSLVDIQKLYELGYRIFGENRVQEAITKFSNFGFNDIDLNLIGPLQTNKVNEALTLFDTIQSIDREKLVYEITKKINSNKFIKTKNYFIQINIGNENQKSGIQKKDAIDFFYFCIDAGLHVIGLMCIPPLNENPEVYFREMVNIRNSINQNLKLSMGMSDDYECALKNKSNIIRVGSKIFQ
jgi:pyridoxal phosphate enzyme (YggS family)